MATTGGKSNTTGLWDLSGADQPKLPSGTRDTTTSGFTTENTTQVQQQSGSKAVSYQNTPQFALDALKSLISQLSDRPAISAEEAELRYPTLKVEYTPNGWLLIDPLTGLRMNATDPKAIQLQQERKVLREQLISSGGIIKGGTLETLGASKARQEEIQRNREQQGKYSKEAAFADASALTGRFTRQLMEQLLPQITRATEASGTSGGAVRGLLAQDAAARVAEAQAALGLQTSAQYGQLYNQLAPVLELLTREQQDPTMQALLRAIELSRGTVNIGGESSATSSTTQTTGTKQITQNEDVVQDNKMKSEVQPSKYAGISTEAIQYYFGQPQQPSGPSSMQISVSQPTIDDALLKLLDESNRRSGADNRIYEFQF